MRFVMFLAAMLSLGVAVVAETTSPPFKLKNAYGHRPIPDGLGMRFFEGKWDYVDNSGSFPVTVTDKAFINVERSHATPYRVLVEAPNYVLLAALLRPDFKDGANIPWTNFVVVVLRHYEGADPYTDDAYMRYYYCRAESMRGGDHAFSWSRKKLMRVFKDSRCFSGIDPEDEWPFGNWGSARYQRR